MRISCSSPSFSSSPMSLLLLVLSCSSVLQCVSLQGCHYDLDSTMIRPQFKCRANTKHAEQNNTAMRPMIVLKERY